VWFIFLGIGLVVLVIGGVYGRARLAGALTQFGASRRAVRIVRWISAWLLFGYPLLVFVAVVAAFVLGWETVPRLDGRVASWLLGIPFLWSLLVVLQSLPWLLASDLVYLIVRRRWPATRTSRLRAVAILAVLGGFAIYTPARIVADRGELRVREYRLGASNARPPFRIAFLSDIHQDVHTDADRVREVYSLVNARHPDLILSGGDWISTGPDHIESAAAAAGTLRSRLGTFSVRGDHEHFAYRDRERSVHEVEAAMAAHRVTMLDNEVRWFDHGGKRIAVLLLNYNYVHRTPLGVVATLVASMGQADYSIVVTHQLDAQLARVFEGKIDLVLAGHTHGGQVNPVAGLVHVPLARLETPFVDGRYALGSTTVIVTSGVGYSIVPIRYASPASIELLEIAL
jgi:predicted MPP superfamily phosphohydrolase